MMRRHRAIWISTVVALVALGTSTLLVLSWRDQLPDPVATHWSFGGAPNGFMGITGFAWLMSAILAGVILMFAALGMSIGRSATGRRTMVGAILYMGGVGALINVLTIAPQRGLPAATDAVLPGWVLFAVLFAPLVPALAGAALVPRQFVPDAASPPPPDAPRVELHDGRIPTWHGQTSANPIGAAVGLLLLIFLFVWISAAAASWAFVIVGIALVFLVGAGLKFNIVAGEDGLIVRSWAGWPTKRVLATTIESAEAVSVHPLQEFGGWGYRLAADGEEGIVVRKGEGIRVRYGNGQQLVVTVNDDPQGAAATLNTAATLAYTRVR